MSGMNFSRDSDIESQQPVFLQNTEITEDVEVLPSSPQVSLVMSSMSPSHDWDIESQQQVSLTVSDPPRKRWQRIYLIMQACHLFISVADKAKKVSIPSIGEIGIGSEGDVNTEIAEDAEVLPPSPHLSAADDSNVSDINLPPEKINQIVKAKDLGSLSAFGGVQGVAKALGTDLEKGIPGDEDDFRSRRTVNTLSEAQAPTEGFLQLLLKSCNDPVICLLSVSAAMSIGFGIEEKGAKTGWCEGAFISLAVIIIVVVSSMRDFWHGRSKKRQEQQRTSEKKMEIDVLRGGSLQKIISYDVVPGDIVCLRRGNTVPGDGLFISGDKVPGDGLFISKGLKLDDGLTTINEQNPFLYHGAKVVNGYGRMLVTSTGMNTSWNEQMSRVNKAPSKNRLPAQLDKISICSQISGLLITIFSHVVVFLRYKLEKEKHENGVPETIGRPIPINELMDTIRRIFMTPSGKYFWITSLSVLAVGMVEGGPFVISLAVVHWNKKALRAKAFSQESLACVGMGSVTTICTEKIGGLTLNQQEVGMGWIGEEPITEDSAIEANVLEAWFCGISADVLKQQDSSNSTENPILYWAKSKLGMEMELLGQTCTIVDPKEPTSSEGDSKVLLRKRRGGESCMYMHLKGPAKEILDTCSFYYDSDGTTKDMDEGKRLRFNQIIDNMRSKQLHPMAFACKQVDGTPFEDNSLVMIGMLGLKRTCQKEIGEAIEALRNAGVNVIMISEDKVSVLKTICTEYGLLCNSGGLVLDSEEFRSYGDEKKIEMVDKICGIGSCSSQDKLELVQCLKRKGRVVAMVGARTADAPAVKEANLGITMGYGSSESARESSDIIIQDGNFDSLVTILSYGRCTYSNIRKYTQFQLTMLIAGSLIIAITTIASGNSPFTSIQWCWASLMVAFPGGLALLTEQARKEHMDKPPISRTESFISKTMWRNIMSQALFQTVILLAFQFKSKSILRINDKVIQTMIFNSFVLCQVFNLFNARGSQMQNVFKYNLRNLFFWTSVGVMLVLQVVFIQTARALAGDPMLNSEQWGICFLIGTVSWAIDSAAKSTTSFILNCVKSPSQQVSSLQCSQTGSVGVTVSKSASNLEFQPYESQNLLLISSSNL